MATGGPSYSSFSFTGNKTNLESVSISPRMNWMDLCSSVI